MIMSVGRIAALIHKAETDQTYCQTLQEARKIADACLANGQITQFDWDALVAWSAKVQDKRFEDNAREQGLRS
jgi:hypothetical protein